MRRVTAVIAAERGVVQPLHLLLKHARKLIGRVRRDQVALFVYLRLGQKLGKFVEEHLADLGVLGGGVFALFRHRNGSGVSVVVEPGADGIDRSDRKRDRGEHAKMRQSAPQKAVGAIDDRDDDQTQRAGDGDRNENFKQRKRKCGRDVPQQPNYRARDVARAPLGDAVDALQDHEQNYHRKRDRANYPGAQTAARELARPLAVPVRSHASPPSVPALSVPSEPPSVGESGFSPSL